MLTAKPDQWNGDVAIVLAHGAGQGIDSPFMRFFNEGLCRAGFLSAMFNFEYMERKRKIPDPQPKMQALYRQVIQEVRQQHRPRRIVIGGKSMGGRVASYIAKDAAVDGLIFLGYPLHPPGQPDKIRDAHLYEISVPMLFLTGTRDPFAERNLLEGVVKKLGSRAMLRWIEGGDHSLKASRKNTDSWIAALDQIRSWAARL